VGDLVGIFVEGTKLGSKLGGRLPVGPKLGVALGAALPVGEKLGRVVGISVGLEVVGAALGCPFSTDGLCDVGAPLSGGVGAPVSHW